MVISATEILDLTSEVLHVTSETSDKFVFAPHKDSILADLLIGLKRFRNTVRWKWFITEEKRRKREKATSPLSQITLSSNSSSSDEDSEKENKKEDEEGLKSGLKSVATVNNAPIGSTEVEAFLKEIEYELIAQVTKDKLVTKPRDEIISKLLERLDESEKVVIATDKTNSFQVVPIGKYKEWVAAHLETSAKEISITRIIEILDLAVEM